MESKFLQRIRDARSFDDLDALRPPYLDDTSPKVPVNIPGLNVSLLPFQRTSIHYMAEIERSRVISNERLNLQVSAGILADKPGTGKTFMILGLIAFDYCQPPGSLDPVGRPPNIINVDIPIDKKTSIVCKRTYKYMLKPNFIFTSGASIKQFAKAIERFTSFKYLLVADLYGLNKMYEYIRNNELGQFHIVLIKNGKIARIPNSPFKTPFTNNNLKTTSVMLDAFAALPLGLYRAFIDDYDTADAPKYHMILPARFTWYVSSTSRKQTRTVKSKSRPPANSFEEMLLYQYQQSASILDDQYMRLFSVQNDPDFIQSYNNLTNPIVYLCKFSDPDIYVGLISKIKSHNIVEVIDRINAGALHEAAQLADAEVSTPSGIFNKLLSDKYGEYKQAALILTYVKQARELMSTLPERDGEDRYLQSHLTSGIMPECKYKYLPEMLDRVEEIQNDKLHECENAIARVRESLASADCIVCLEKLASKTIITIMASCCGTVMCGTCVGLCMGFRSVDNKVISSKNCPKCRKSNIDFNSLIHIKPINMDIIDIPFNKPVEEALLYEEKKVEIKEEKRKSLKPLALIDIVRNIIPYEAQRINRKIGIQQGSNVEVKHKGPNKILVYAMYSESVENICKEFAANQIKYYQLGGRPKDIQKTIDDFDASREACVLIVNGTKYCSGLNLQSATHTVLYHKISGGNEIQIIGRTHRLMRPSTAIVYYFLFENELDEFVYDEFDD